MRRVSAWLTPRWAADASKAGNRETRCIGSRPNRQQVRRGAPSQYSRGSSQPGMPQLPWDYQGLGWSFPRGGKASVTERKGEDVHESEVAGPGRG
jgi:hypothetical protein